MPSVCSQAVGMRLRRQFTLSSQTQEKKSASMLTASEQKKTGKNAGLYGSNDVTCYVGEVP